MATRADQKMVNALIVSKKVGTAVTKGKLVKFVTDDDHVTDASAGEAGIGIALETSSTADASVRIALLSAASIVPVLVGTGGATRGAFAAAVSNGFATQAVANGALAVLNLCGIFMQSGSAGDFVGLLPFPTVAPTAAS